jgi:hypothetical protein
MATKRRTIVGSPLTPELLAQLGVAARFSQPATDLHPDRNWVHTYRIWACHGYRKSGNKDVGFVRIKRLAGRPGKEFTLNVHQEIVQTDGLLNVTTADITCLHNPLASPIRWQLSERFTDPADEDVTELQTKEKGFIRADVLTVEVAGRTLKRQVGKRFTSDWCLFEAVQRLQLDKGAALTFDLLQGQACLKENQQLLYRGVHQQNLSGKYMPLHRFDHLGRGNLPFEYWLDERHRLLTIISMNKTFIFDPQAEQTVRQATEKSRRSYQRRRRAKGK